MVLTWLILSGDPDCFRRPQHDRRTNYRAPLITSGPAGTLRQEAVLRRAADVSHKSLTDFILDSACQAAEQTLLDQRLFMASGVQFQALMTLPDRPAKNNQGLRDLFSRSASWKKKRARAVGGGVV